MLVRKVHADELRRLVAAFFASTPYAVSWKRQPDTRRLVYFVSRVEATPDEITVVFGDVVQNLRTALDHLAYQLVDKDTAGKPPNVKTIYFPFGTDQADYDARKVNYLKGVSAATLARIDALKPYAGGVDGFRRLHSLNNVEKHRLLLTVGTSPSVNLVASAALRWKESDPEIYKAFAGMSAFFREAGDPSPLQVGHQLLITQPDEEFNPAQNFRFALVVREADDGVDGIDLIPLVDELIAVVENALDQTKDLLA